ncbi:hypothetical protein HMPREF0290_0818, partial [Corynebacterium efficiens YS-314]
MDDSALNSSTGPIVKMIKLIDGEEIELGEGAVFALVGANNSGKTYFLKTLRAQLHGDTIQEVSADGGLIEGIKMQWATASAQMPEYLENLADHHFQRNERNYR